MKITERLGLKLPEGSDYVSIDMLNEIFEKLDALILQNTGGTMAGKLTFSGIDMPEIFLQRQDGRGEAVIYPGTNNVCIASRNTTGDSTVRRAFHVYNSNQRDLATCLRLLDKVEGEEKFYSILHTGNLEALGVARVATGSYMGTGVSGSTNACRVEVSFKPLALIVFEKEHMSSMLMSCCPWTSYAEIGRTSTVSLPVCEWGDNFVSWYYPSGISGSVEKQFNDSNKEYQYIVFG